MNLYDLKEEVEELRVFQNNHMKQIKELRNKIESPRTTSYTPVKAKGKPIALEKTLDRLTILECEFEESVERLDELKPLIDELEAIYKQYNDRDKLIYLEKKIKGWTNIKIAMRHGISVATVKRITSKINNQIKN